MTIAHRSTSILASGTRSTSTISAPTGMAADDVVLVSINVGRSGSSAPTITSSDGLTLVKDVTYGSSFDSYWVRDAVYQYVVPGSGALTSFAFTHLSSLSDGSASAYTGVDTTTPIDATPTSNTGAITSGDPNAHATGLTTVTDGAMLAIARGSWDGNAITPPSGWTERVDHAVTWYGDKIQTAAGATGTIDVNAGNTYIGGYTSPWSIMLIPLRPASTGGTYTGTLSASAPTATAGVPTSAISGTTTVPTYTGSVAASTPAATAGVPTASITGTTTVPTSTGAVSANAPTVTAGVPTAAITGTVSVPVYAGAVAADAPIVTAGPPTASITGTATVPVYTGSIVASTPGVTAGVPTAAITGTFIAPGGGTLNASAPTITAGPPTAAMSGTYTAPAAVAGVLSSSAPAVTVGPPVATITGATVVPVWTGTLSASLPTITALVPVATMSGRFSASGFAVTTPTSRSSTVPARQKSSAADARLKSSTVAARIKESVE